MFLLWQLGLCLRPKGLLRAPILRELINFIIIINIIIIIVVVVVIIIVVVVIIIFLLLLLLGTVKIVQIGKGNYLPYMKGRSTSQKNLRGCCSHTHARVHTCTHTLGTRRTLDRHAYDARMQIHGSHADTYDTHVHTRDINTHKYDAYTRTCNAHTEHARHIHNAYQCPLYKSCLEGIAHTRHIYAAHTNA